MYYAPMSAGGLGLPHGGSMVDGKKEVVVVFLIKPCSEIMSFAPGGGSSRHRAIRSTWYELPAYFTAQVLYVR